MSQWVRAFDTSLQDQDLGITFSCSVIFCLILFLYLAALSLSCNMWDLVPWPRIKPWSPILGAQSLSHWTTREVPPCYVINACHQVSPASRGGEMGSTFCWKGPQGMFVFYLCVCVCVYVCAQLCLTLCDPMDCSYQAPLSIDFSRQEYRSGWPFPSPGDLPDPGTEPTSLKSSALAGRFFTTSITWEAPVLHDSFQMANQNFSLSMGVYMY